MLVASDRAKQAWIAVPLIRLMVGAVFLSEGIQKFLYPALRGAGRFADIGFPIPDIMGYGVGAIEVAAGAMVLMGFYTRQAVIPLAIIMIGAIITTKIPILLGQGFGPFVTPDVSEYGFWSMAHAMRTDWAMLLGSIFLYIAGSGAWSVDEMLRRRMGTYRRR